MPRHQGLALVVAAVAAGLMSGCANSGAGRAADNTAASPPTDKRVAEYNIAPETIPDLTIVSGTLHDPKGIVRLLPTLPTIGPLYRPDGKLFSPAGIISIPPEVPVILAWDGPRGGRGRLKVTACRMLSLDDANLLKGSVIWLGSKTTEQGFYLAFATLSTSGEIVSGPCSLLKGRADLGMPDGVRAEFRSRMKK